MPELGETTRSGSPRATDHGDRRHLDPHPPAAAMLAAYEADPSLAAMRLDFTATLREVLEVLIAGLLAGPS